jgi:signal transduction histidine kinase
MVSAADKLGSQQLQFAQLISENTDKMINHVNKLIDIAEIQRGTLQLRKQWEPFGRLVRETVESWEERMESKRLALELKMSDDNVWMFVDTVRLVWAIDNLIQNAHDYTLGKGNVTVSACQEGNEIHIHVSDTGIGINAADQPHLFSRFYRIQNEHTFNIPGLGLDLFITRSIIEAHGGRVWVKSALGQGSTFSIALPLVEPPEDLSLE